MNIQMFLSIIKIVIKKNVVLYIYMYIQTWLELLAPLVNMIKRGYENQSALLILLIFI